MANSFCVEGGRYIDMPFNACFTVNPCKGCPYWDYDGEGCGIKPEIKKTAQIDLPLLGGRSI